VEFKELLSIMVLVAISKADCCVRPSGRMVVMGTLRSSPREEEAERKRERRERERKRERRAILYFFYNPEGVGVEGERGRGDWWVFVWVWRVWDGCVADECVNPSYAGSMRPLLRVGQRKGARK
jgi:hypothetical protein